MSRANIHLAALSIVVLVPLLSCGPNEPMTSAVGSYSDVAILTDLDVLGGAAEQLARSLDIQLEYSLKPEPLFNVAVFDMKERRQAWVYKNVILIGLLDGRDAASKELRKQIGGQTVKAVGSDELFVAVADDVWARNQAAFFIAGRERNLLQSAMRRGRDPIVSRIQKKNRERMREFLFSDGHEAELEARIQSELGFSLQVPASFRETRLRRDGDEGVVEVAKVRPTRTLAIVYRDGVEPDMVEDPEALLQLRREWGERFLSEGLQDAGGFTWSEEPLGARMLPVLAGFWEADEGARGGPFRTFFLYNEERRRLYGVNLLCYAPGMAKHTYMRETHAVAETLVP